MGKLTQGQMGQSLNQWGRVTHICVSKLTIIASDNGLSPGRRQAIIWTSAGILLNGPLGTNFSEILIDFIAFSSKKMRLKVSSAKWRPCCLGLNVLNQWGRVTHICDSKLNHHWFRWRLVACLAPSHNWNNADILSIGTLGINFREILIKIHYICIHENAF